MTRRAAALLVLGLLPAACRKAGEEAGKRVPEDVVIARVDGEPVPRGLFEAYLRDNINLIDDTQSPPSGGKGAADAASTNAISDDVRSRLLDRFLLEQGLVAQARAAAVEVSEEDLDRFSQAIGLGPVASLHEGAPFTEREYLRRYLENCLRVKRFLDKSVLAGTSATDDEAQAWYGEHASHFSKADRYRLRLIRVDSLKEAQDIVRQIGKDGTAFLKVARSLSEGVEGEQGKDLGSWAADELPDAFARAVAPLRKGEVSGVVQDPDGGFNVLFLEDKEEGGTVPFASVREKLKTALAREKKAAALATFMESLKAKLRVQIVEPNLGFRYVVPTPATAENAATPSPAGSEAAPPVSTTPATHGGA